jgi:hypothetical protein
MYVLEGEREAYHAIIYSFSSYIISCTCTCYFHSLQSIIGMDFEGADKADFTLNVGSTGNDVLGVNCMGFDWSNMELKKDHINRFVSNDLSLLCLKVFILTFVTINIYIPGLYGFVQTVKYILSPLAPCINVHTSF